MPVTLASLRPAIVGLEDMLTGLPAYLPETRWNGWECPYFRAADVRAARAKWDAFGAELHDSDIVYTWDDTTDLPSMVTTYEDGKTENEVSTMMIDGECFVTVGSGGWVWCEESDDLHD